MHEPTDLIQRTSVVSMIAEVDKAKDEVAQAFTLLRSAKKRLTKTLGNYHDSIVRRDLRDYEFSDERTTQASHALIERNAWQSVVSRLNVREIVSVAKRKQIEKQLEDGELPALTEDNVVAFMQQLFMDMDSLLEDSAREVFDWLRPTSSWHKLKTNTKNTFGIKNKAVIVYGMESTYGGGMPRRVNYRDEKHIRSLDNVFHLLDGQGVAKYPDDLCTRISDAGSRRETSVETPYFKCKWFKNSNLHIEFKRMDLVAKLNKMAGGSQLKDGE